MAEIKKRIKYMDTLKAFAIMGIVFLHCFNLWNPILVHGINMYNLNQIARPGVPIFIMVSGALLLGRDENIKLFFKKRFVRVCYPLLFFIPFTYILNIEPNPLVAYWFCWMIIGAYLAIPFISKIINNSSIVEIEYFLIIFLFAIIFYQIMQTIDYKFSLDLNFFITPVSYLMLGYYLSKKEFALSPSKIIIISTIVFIISTLIKMKLGNFWDVYPKINMYSALDFSIFQVLQASSFFLIVRYIYSDGENIFSNIKKLLEKEIINKIILSISRSSYGIYLVHMLFVMGIYRPFAKTAQLTGSQMFIYCVLAFFFAFIASWIITLILSRIPYINKISGYA